MRASAKTITLVALALSAAACTRARRTPDDTLVVVLDSDVTDVDPRFCPNSLDTKVSRLVAVGLVTVDQASLEPRPLLAQNLELVDPLTWDVTVRADARFSDGAPVTADDVIFTFASTMDAKVGSRYRKNFMERIDRLEKLDDRRVRFHLKEPLATFQSDLDYGIVERRAATAPGQRYPDGRVIGAGPYAVVSIKPGLVVLERNPYYLEGPPPLRRVVIKTIRDANARLLVLVGGSADFMQNGVRLDLLDEVARRRRLQVTTAPSALVTYLMFNLDDPALSNPEVRQAIAYAIDRPKLIRRKFGGHAVIATAFLPTTHWAYNPDVPRYDYDPARARALLDEAGYPDPDGPGGKPRLKLTYKTSSDLFRISLARLIAAQLADVGIEVEVRPFELNTLITDLKKGNFQLSSLQSSEIVEPDVYWAYFHSSRIPTPEFPDNLNRTRYRSAEADALLWAGRHEPDRQKRKAIYARLQVVLATDLPALPLWHEDNVAVMNKDVDGYVLVPNARLGGIARVHKR
jgi:peptide/nickel transport system substrate-binding protein